jgi:hypothetical protein
MLDSHKCTLIHEQLSKSVLLQEIDSRKLLFYHLADVTHLKKTLEFVSCFLMSRSKLNFWHKSDLLYAPNKKGHELVYPITIFSWVTWIRY